MVQLNVPDELDRRLAASDERLHAAQAAQNTHLVIGEHRTRAEIFAQTAAFASGSEVIVLALHRAQHDELARSAALSAEHKQPP